MYTGVKTALCSKVCYCENRETKFKSYIGIFFYYYYLICIIPLICVPSFGFPSCFFFNLGVMATAAKVVQSKDPHLHYTLTCES